MKTLLFLLFCNFLFITVSAQDTQNIAVTTDQEAMYPQGPEELIKLIYKSIKFTDEACIKELNTDVELSFDVMPDSSLSNIQIITKVGFGVDDEILRIFKKIKYQPAIMMGMKIRRNIFQTIPIRTNKMMLDDKSRKAPQQQAVTPATTPATNLQNNDED